MVFFLSLTVQLDNFSCVSRNSAGAQQHHDCVIVVVGLNHVGLHISVKPCRERQQKHVRFPQNLTIRVSPKFS